jgi:hypothetical protein
MSWQNHIPHIPTEAELDAAPVADALQAHEVFECEHPACEIACYELATRPAAQAA